MKSRTCCWPVVTVFRRPGSNVSIAVEGDDPKKILEETELLDFIIEKKKRDLWNVKYGSHVTVEDIKAPNADYAFYKSRWHVNQMNIFLEDTDPCSLNAS